MLPTRIGMTPHSLSFLIVKISVCSNTMRPISVRDVTLMSDQSVHFVKWISALEQVTVSHLAKGTKSIKVCQISDSGDRHLYECHGVALSLEST